METIIESTIVVYIQYKFDENLSLGYLVRTENGLRQRVISANPQN